MDEKELKPQTLFWFTAPIVGVIALLAIIYPNLVSEAFTNGGHIIYTLFDWMIVWLPLVVLLLCLYFAFSKTGKIRLGGVDAKPEYTTFSWISMLFTAGIGVGLIFYGPLEGLWHYQYSNYSNLPGLTDSQKTAYAMSTSVWLWGAPAWAFYTLGATIVSYFTYVKKTNMSTGAPISYAFKNHKWSGAAAKAALCLTVITIGISLASSLAMAAGQVNGGLRTILGIPDLEIAPWVLFGIFILYSICAVTPVQKGMKYLSNFTVIVAIGLMLFIFLVGPTRYFMMNLIETIGHTLMGTFTQSFNLFIFDESRYFMNWFANSYFVWWCGWSTLIGVWTTSISRGRTLKQMILASIFVPSGFILIWFSTFSGYGLLDTIQGSGELAQTAATRYQEVIYILLDKFPLAEITKPILAVLFIAFVITTIVSGCITLGILTGNDGVTASKPKILIWGFFMSAIAFPFVLSGKIEGIKAVGSLIGFPFMFFYILSIAALIKTVRKDNKNIEKNEA